jgi:hypothetical protein
MAAFTASIKSGVATYWAEPWNFIVLLGAIAAACAGFGPV